MLTLLNISNIALIDELRVEFEPALNLLTGETGSGKSIIVDALGLLIGARFASDLLKAGAARGSIEGLFSVARNPELESLLESAELGVGEDERLEEERRRLMNVEKLTTLGSESFALIYEDHDSAITRLRQAMKRVEELSQYESSFRGYLEGLESARALLEDLA